jgi:alpha-L-rhamnosidase
VASRSELCRLLWSIHFYLEIDIVESSTKKLMRLIQMLQQRPSFATLFLSLAVTLAAAPTSMSEAAQPESLLSCVDLRCEYRENPLGIDEAKPRLSWKVTSPSRGQSQSAYQILVATTREKLEQGQADLWDSGVVKSNRTLHIEYDGAELQSSQTCFWKVKSWNQDQTESAWSPVASWTMGLLSESDWEAAYISIVDNSPIFKDRTKHYLPPAHQYRKPFSTDKKVKRATVYATALGIYELEFNGQRVGNAYFAPGWTDYRQRAYYNTYDVTQLLHDGDNVMGANVAEGWYSGYVGFGLLVGIGTEKIGRYTYGKTPSFMAQLEIEYQDGSKELVVTDPSWKVTDAGPIRRADLLMGEYYDARVEMPGWSSPGFDDSDWQQAILARESGPQLATFYEAQETPEGNAQVMGREIDLGFKRPRLESFPGVPVVITEEIKPIEITKRDAGNYIFNLGQNFAGNIRLKLRGIKGQLVTIRYAEMLHPDGRMMTENLRKARATDYYVCKGGDDVEIFTPRFTFHGFQYVEVSNFPGEPTEDTVTGLVMHSDTPMVSSFECSDPMVNRLHQNVLWTQRANFIDLPTDCPQRDERMGWTGDAQAYIATAAYNADIGAFFTKWNRELMESQRPSGAFPGYAPFPFQHGKGFGSAWSDAGVICPWTIWQVYDDTRMIDRCWEPMTQFMQWRDATSIDDLGIVHGNEWGDWLAQGENTPLDYVDSIYYAITTKMMAEMAEATGRTAEAKNYRQQFQRTKVAFYKKYVRPDGGINVPTQTAHALALFADLIPQDLRAGTGEKLAQMIGENGNRMATGFLGTRPLLPVLSSVDQHDLATFLLQSREFPSWGYEIAQGATSIWERWDSFTKEDGFGRHNAAMNSFSHYAFGAVNEWMFRTLAGIDSTSPGYQTINIRPTPPSPGSNAVNKPINWVKASHNSIRGKIAVDWKLAADQFHLNVSIPANSTAQIYLPTNDTTSIQESGKTIGSHPHVKFLRQEDGNALLSVASGDYEFVCKSNLKSAATGLKNSPAKDKSINPQEVDLKNAKQIASWDFTQAADRAKWKTRNCKFEIRDGKTFVVATGNDSQAQTALQAPVTGPIAIRLKAMPTKGATSQFFLAAEGKPFNARNQIKRQLKPSETANDYLFQINAPNNFAKLRFDPFQLYDPYANKAEMVIESISIFALPATEDSQGQGDDQQKQTAPANSGVDTTGAARKKFPNILFFLAEDQGAHLSHLGTPGLQTPNIDALARSGVYFSNAFVAYPVCSASKASIYTGLHCHTNGILNNTHNFHKPASQVTAGERGMQLAKTNKVRDRYLTLVEILQANGYRQGVTHKLHVLPNEKFPYDQFMQGGQGEIQQFFKQAGNDNRPWFLLVNMPYSHRPYPNSDKVKIRVDPETIQLPSYLPDTPEIRKDWAEYLAGIEKVDDVVGQTMKTLDQTGNADDTIVVYMSDHGPTFQHGKMTMYDLGLRTPLIVSGPGIKPGSTDALASGVDILPTLLDLMTDKSGAKPAMPQRSATGSAAGQTGKLPYPIHGQSLADIVRGKENASQREFVFAEISNRGPLPNKGIQERSVFDGQWKLIYRENVGRRWRQVNADSRMFKTWGNRTYAETIRMKDQNPEAYRVLQEMDPQKLGGQVPKLELYNLAQDPDEMNNLVGKPDYAQHVTRLRNALKRWKQKTNDASIRLAN